MQLKLRKGTYKTDPGEFYGTPKELWGFRAATRSRRADTAARSFLRANAELLGLDDDLAGLEHQKTISSLGAKHVIFQQRHLGRRVHRAYVTVHVGRDGIIFLAKNRAVPSDLLPEKAQFRLDEIAAIKRARKTLPSGGRRATALQTEAVWFPRGAGLVPSWRVRLGRTGPREEWIVYVNARTGGILSRYDNLAKSSRGRARIFDPSPVTALGGHESLLSSTGRQRKPPPEAYRTVTLRGLAGNGYLEGRRVTTRPSRRRVRRRNGQFVFDSRERGFEEVMVYHHVDAAVRYLQRLGFRGSRAIFRSPVRVDVNGTRADDSWYSPFARLITLGTGYIDDAEDAETILHELGHAIQDAICPDFGQSAEAGAMGEGFGDYFAASVFAERKPERYRTSVMTWDGLLIGLDEGLDPPCLRRVDAEWTYDDFIPDDDVHENGEIWSATLWDVREKLGGRRPIASSSRVTSSSTDSRRSPAAPGPSSTPTATSTAATT